MFDREDSRYYSLPLNEKNISDWFLVAKNCSYSWQDILDKQLIEKAAKSEKKTKYILYNSSNKDPIAVFYSDYKILSYKKFFINLKFKSLNTQFNGLFINDKYHKEFKKILSFAELDFIQHIKKDLKIDFLIYSPSPILSILQPESIVKQILFPKENKIKFEGIILNKLNKDILSSINKKSRYEINKGLKYFDKNKLVFDYEKEKISFPDFEKLEKYKSNKKGIPFLKDHFLSINKNKNYKFFMISGPDSEPISLAFIRIFKNIATFRYNSSSALGREYFINKVLLYKIYNYLKDNGIEYFILGNINDIEGVKYFKESLSNQTIVNNNYITMFSLKSKILNLLKKL